MTRKRRAVRRLLPMIATSSLLAGLMAWGTAPAALATVGCALSQTSVADDTLTVLISPSATNVVLSTTDGTYLSVSGTGLSCTPVAGIAYLIVAPDSGTSGNVVKFAAAGRASFWGAIDKRVTLGDGEDTVWLEGTAGTDTIDASSFLQDDSNLEHYLIEGLGGNDDLIGSDLDDTIRGGANADDIDAGDGDDLIDEEAATNGADEIHGGGGVDTVDYHARTLAVRISISSGDDDSGQMNTAVAGPYPSTELDTIFGDIENGIGGAGNDELYGDADANELTGNGGGDRIDGNGGPDTIRGGSGIDYLTGGAGNDDLDGGADSDRAQGDGGDDVIAGGAGDDRPSFNGSPGWAGLFGGTGDDRFDEGTSANGSDDVDGGAGRDTLDYSGRTASVSVTLDAIRNDGASSELDRDMPDENGASSIEDIRGGSGADTLTGSAADNDIKSGPGDDMVYGLGGENRIWADGGDDQVWGGANYDRVWGGSGNDIVHGGESGDWLHGQGGNDTLFGDGGNDWIHGGGGRDDLSGGTGYDWCNGGGGGGTVTDCDVTRPKDGADWAPYDWPTLTTATSTTTTTTTGSRGRKVTLDATVRSKETTGDRASTFAFGDRRSGLRLRD